MVRPKSRKSASKSRNAHPAPKHLKKPAEKPRREKPSGPAAAEKTKPVPHSSATQANGQARPELAQEAQNAAVGALGTIKSQSGVDLTEKIKELVRLAQEQGYLTFSDINDALPDSMIAPEELDEIYSK